jgi:hypothetical protein
VGRLIWRYARPVTVGVQRGTAIVVGGFSSASATYLTEVDAAAFSMTEATTSGFEIMTA